MATKRGSRWVNVLPYLAVVFITIQLFYNNVVIDKQLSRSEIERRIESSIRSIEDVVDMWHSGHCSDLEIDSLWFSMLNNPSDKNDPTLILMLDGCVRYWQGEVPNTDILSLGSSSSVDSLSHSVVLSFSRQEGRTRSIVVVPLLGDDGSYNDYLFPHLRDMPIISEPVEGDQDVLKVRGKEFSVKYQYKRQQSTVINIIGWLGILIALYYIRVRIGRNASPRNIVRKLVILGIIFTIIRVVIYYVDIPMGASDSWNSTSSLILSYVILYLFIELPYIARFKLRRRLQQSSVRFRYFFFILVSSTIAAAAVYIYSVTLNNIHTNIVVLSLGHLMEMNYDLVLIYVAYSIFAAVMVVYCLTLRTVFVMIPALIRVVIHIVLFAAAVLVTGHEFNSTILLLAIVGLLSLSITIISKNAPSGLVFVIVMLISSTFVSIFTVVESNASHINSAKMYSEKLLEDRSIADDLPEDVWYVELNRSVQHIGNDSRYEVGVIDRFADLSEGSVEYFGGRAHVYAQSDSRAVIVSIQYYGALEVATLWCYITLIFLLICSSIIQFSGISIYPEYSRNSLIYKVRSAMFFAALVSIGASVVFAIYIILSGERTINSRALGNVALGLKADLDSAMSSDSLNIESIVGWLEESRTLPLDVSVAAYDTTYMLRSTTGSLELGMLLDNELFAQLNYGMRAVAEMVIEQGDRVEYAVPIVGNGAIQGYLVVAARNYAKGGVRGTFWGDVLGNVLNLLVAFLLFSLLITIVFYRIISRPLRVLYDNMKRIGSLRMINMQNVDMLGNEIGAVVMQYNSMIEYVHSNYKHIVENERESAWREAARQIAHEIKNPLTPMRLRIELMQYYRQVDASKYNIQMDETLKLLANQVEVLSNIASELSDIARIKDGAFQSADIRKVISNVASLYTSMGAVTVNIHCDISGELLVKADYVSLSRVVLNVVKNAVEAMQWDGIIDISLRSSAGFAIVEVRDRGVGLSDKVLKSLFTGNFTTKAQGSGLGLRICRGIVMGYGGTITAKNHSEIGAVFTISLPLC